MTDGLLSSLERSLSAELKQATIPGSVEAAVMRHFDRARMRRRALVGTIIAGAVAGLFFAAGTAVEQRHRAPLAVTSKPAPSLHLPPLASAAPESAARDNAAPFIAIPYSPPLDANDRATVIRMSLPLPALAAAGLPIIAAEPDALAQADVLVAEDGQPRAIRVLSISTNENRR